MRWNLPLRGSSVTDLAEKERREEGKGRSEVLVDEGGGNGGGEESRRR